MSKKYGRARAGFTIIELLVVIGIIALLTAILVPVVSSVRRKARVADTQNQIGRLSAAIERYFNDFQAYPGPYSNDAIITPGSDPSVASAMITGKLTMSENLVLGLLGGLSYNQNTNAVTFSLSSVYHAPGPVKMNPFDPHQYNAYIEAKPDELTPEASGGRFKDAANRAADDSTVPEFLDRFGDDKLPILYLRSRTGAPGIMSEGGIDKEAPGAAGTQAYQYDLNQISGYVKQPIGLTTGYTTTGNKVHGITEPGSTDGTKNPDGMLVEKDPGTGLGSLSYRNKYLPYFKQTGGTSASGSSAGSNASGTPKQKDGFILISAGEDRVYGTLDDVTNIGGLHP